jgi:hypothetical protein
MSVDVEDDDGGGGGGVTLFLAGFLVSGSLVEDFEPVTVAAFEPSLPKPIGHPKKKAKPSRK